MRIYLIRHGRQSNRLCNADVDLSAEGRRQAELLGKRLRPFGIEAVYSSDLIRAVETAERANRFWGVGHIIRPELREISFGELEGLSEGEIARRFPDLKREQEMMERDLPYPGGECGADVIRRVRPVISEIKRSGFKRVAVVTHGGVIRSVVSSFLHMDSARFRLLGSCLENCGITEIAFHREAGFFTLERFNDYAHLEAYPELLRGGWTKEAQEVRRAGELEESCP